MSWSTTFGRALLVLWAALVLATGAVPMQFTQAAVIQEKTESEKTSEESEDKPRAKKLPRKRVPKVLPQVVAEKSVVVDVATLGESVLDAREQNIRGIARERSRFRTHILPSPIASKRFDELTLRDIREWDRWMADRMASTREGQPPRKLARATISRARSLLSVICKEAVERELLETNPCDLVKPPKCVDARDTEDVWSYLTWDEQQRIVACEDIPRAAKLAILFAIRTGLRRGEQGNLRLADLHVDVPEPYVYVRFSNPFKGEDAPPKNGKKRKVPLVGDAVDIAREWLALLPSYARENPLGLVFPTVRGCRRQPGNPLGRSYSIHDAYAAAGITARPGLHWHALRHTFASNLISGVFGRRWSIAEISKLMGHSSISVTERYAHLGEDAIKQAVREANAAALALATIAVTRVGDAATEKTEKAWREAWLAELWAALRRAFVAVIRGRGAQSAQRSMKSEEQTKRDAA